VSEGFDLPAIETAILLRPTQSLALYLQQVGRALRPFDGKDKATILDHAGNVMRHGLPDEDRQWSLNGSKRQKSEDPASPGVTICKNCFAAIKSGSPQCPECGAVIPKKEREINSIDGELAELDLKKLAEERKKKLSEAKTLEDLMAYGKAMGYRNPHQWAGHIWTARRLRNQGHARH
jgi:superfamily II DNA or RNA helicase